MKQFLHILSALVVLALAAVSCDFTESPQAEAGRAIVFGDEAGLRRLGCRFTSDPYYATNALFTGEK